MSYQSELYQQIILEHNRKPKNFREMKDHTHSCKGNNPLCGDKYIIALKVDKDSCILDISFTGSGCAISKASASLMTTYLKGKKVEEARLIFNEFHRMVLGEFDPDKESNHLGKLKILKGVQGFSSRIKCATLAWHTLICALDRLAETTSE